MKLRYLGRPPSCCLTLVSSSTPSSTCWEKEETPPARRQPSPPPPVRSSARWARPLPPRSRRPPETLSSERKHFSLHAYTDYISEEEKQKVELMLAFLTEESKQAAASTAVSIFIVIIVIIVSSCFLYQQSVKDDVHDKKETIGSCQQETATARDVRATRSTSPGDEECPVNDGGSVCALLHDLL
ncbi:hypothetical protein L3Q82_024479 [Scortum barcoo]|uniref:Uncharacterized protein n=1 Tax=Scortum barcoo TaxID=214431 RepID=A0ACB8WSB6_9TELE|nr:hypothetical protein L3Q82_024479 [Scortum barcoo]